MITEKKKTMINVNTFSRFTVDRCQVLLNESESYFIYSKFCNVIGNNIITENNLQFHIENILKEFYYICDNRYFNKKNIKNISKYYTNKILNEELGRGRESGFDPITADKVANFYGDVDFEKGVDTWGEEEIAYLEDDEGNEKVLKIDSPDHATVVINQIKLKSITKN